MSEHGENHRWLYVEDKYHRHLVKVEIQLDEISEFLQSLKRIKRFGIVTQQSEHFILVTVY